MHPFTKSQISSIVATSVDFVVTIVLVELMHGMYAVSSGVGNLTGALSAFALNRTWVFHSNDNKLSRQALRYVLVWCGYFLINISLVTAFTTYTTFNYILVKIGVSIALSICYNYGLYKTYVFR